MPRLPVRGVEIGEPGVWAPTFFKAWAWPLQFCISYYVANIVTAYFILKYWYLQYISKSVWKPTWFLFRICCVSLIEMHLYSTETYGVPSYKVQAQPKNGPLTYKLLPIRHCSRYISDFENRSAFCKVTVHARLYIVTPFLTRSVSVVWRFAPFCVELLSLRLLTSPTIGVQSIATSVYVCLFLCLFMSAPISQKPHLQISPNFLYMLPVPVSHSSSDGKAIHYVLPVLWMTSWANGPESKTAHRFRSAYRVAAPGAKSAVSDCVLLIAAICSHYLTYRLVTSSQRTQRVQRTNLR